MAKLLARLRCLVGGHSWEAVFVRCAPQRDTNGNSSSIPTPSSGRWAILWMRCTTIASAARDAANGRISFAPRPRINCGLQAQVG